MKNDIPIAEVIEIAEEVKEEVKVKESLFEQKLRLEKERRKNQIILQKKEQILRWEILYDTLINNKHNNRRESWSSDDKLCYEFDDCRYDMRDETDQFKEYAQKRLNDEEKEHYRGYPEIDYCRYCNGTFSIVFKNP